MNHTPTRLLPFLSLAATFCIAGCTHGEQTKQAQAAPTELSTESRQCTALKEVSLKHVEITEATWLTAGAHTHAAGGIVSALPAHCLVRGVIDARRGVPAPVRTSKGEPGFNDRYGIHFELRLPEKWAGRFLYQGGGGSDGVVIDAVGLIPSLSDSHGYISALGRGFAVVSSDAGHTEDQNPGFGVDPQARIDYGYASIGRVTPIAKTLITQFYGASAKYSYFAGCSKGGQEALQAMQRYGDAFDGIVSGDPGLRLPHAAVAEMNDLQAFASAAPPDEQGHPDLARSFSDADLQLVADSVRKQCRADDGTPDGLHFDPEHCSFEPRLLQCKGAKAADCLSADQVNALHRVFDGARTASGHQLYAKWPYDPGMASPGWRLWKLGSAKTPAFNLILGTGSMRYVFATPPVEEQDPARMDPATLDHLIRATSGQYTVPSIDFMDADSVQLDRFFAHGGKLLIYHGTADPVFSVLDTIDYYKRLQAKYANRTDRAARLFLVPGMNHCSGGDYALDSFDSLNAMVKWVENDRAPAQLVAQAGRRSGAKLPAGMTRPLCPYPQKPHYTGHGDRNDAANFVCSR